MNALALLQEYGRCGVLPAELTATLQRFFLSYLAAVGASADPSSLGEANLTTYLKLIGQQIKEPHAFESFHSAIRTPFDYYKFALDFIRPLIVFERSIVLRRHLVGIMEQQTARGENVILLGNHQIEPDPQVISLLLEKEYGEFAKKIIFVAGHRVTTDPLAIPLSKGCNLLCIHSKKHIDHPPELKQMKSAHNQATMRKMGQLLAEGGYCIYVAPSGGRDRVGASGAVEVAPFDPQSIEMFWLIAQQAKKATNFYPLALATYHLLPPPHAVDKALGEERLTKAVPAHLAFGEQIDMELFPGSDTPDKRMRRSRRAEHIWRTVQSDYNTLIQHS